MTARLTEVDLAVIESWYQGDTSKSISGTNIHRLLAEVRALWKEDDLKMESWQDRVIEERAELSKKLEKLNIFLASDDNLLHLTNKDVALLLAQSHAMTNYLDILERRIDEFVKS